MGTLKPCGKCGYEPGKPIGKILKPMRQDMAIVELDLNGIKAAYHFEKCSQPKGGSHGKKV